jgi:hypothetical protein
VKALLLKELRDQRVFAVLGLALFAVNHLVDAVFGDPDFEALSETFYELGGAGASVALLVAFAVGTGLLAREADEGTLGFLDGLPLSRPRIWTAKVCCALGVQMVYPVLAAAFAVALHLWSRGSLDHEVHLHLVLQHLGLMLLAIAVSLFAGMLLGFTRALAWACLGLLVSIISWGARSVPKVSLLDPTQLLYPSFVGTRWEVPSDNLLVQLLLAAGLALAGLLAFMRSGRSTRSVEETLKRPLVSAFVAVATVVSLVVALRFMFDRSGDRHEGQTEEAPGAWFSQGAAGHAETQHYRFAYPAHRGERLQGLLEGADEKFEQVSSVLGVDGGEPVSVDLWGSSANTLGTALHESVRMGLDAPDLLGVLAHETTHVLAGRLAREEQGRGLSQMSVFNEGLASWVQRAVSPGDGGEAAMDRFQAAWVSRRKLVEPMLLTDAEKLAQTQDIELQYPLGSTFIQALVERHGREAPRKVLEALGREDFPRDLFGFELWAAAFQLAGYDVGLVFDDYSRLLARYEREHAAELDALPRLRGILKREGEWVGVEVRAERALPEGLRPVVRFKPGRDAELDTLFVVEARPEDQVAWTGRLRFGAEVCFQPGLRVGTVNVFEPWACVPLTAVE